MSRVKASRVHSARPRTRRRATLAGRLADQERIRRSRTVSYDSPVREHTHTTAKGLTYTTTRWNRRGKRPQRAPRVDGVVQMSSTVAALMDKFRRQKV